MWDLPRPGLEPVSSALAGRFLTTVPPGKPYAVFSYVLHSDEHRENVDKCGIIHDLVNKVLAYPFMWSLAFWNSQK